MSLGATTDLNFLSTRAFGKRLIEDSQDRFGRMQQPNQHPFETQTLRTQQSSAAARRRQFLPVEPNPHVPQYQRQGDKEKPHHWTTRTGLDPRLVQLSIARLDAEELTVPREWISFSRTPILQRPVGRESPKVPGRFSY